MDNGATHSHGSISSINTSNQTFESQGTGIGSISQEFVNQGLLLWNRTRQQWTGTKRPEKPQGLREPRLSTFCLCFSKKSWPCSWNATYDSLLGSNKPFSKPVPLSEMVDFLVDIWEQEGMYD